MTSARIDPGIVGELVATRRWVWVTVGVLIALIIFSIGNAVMVTLQMQGFSTTTLAFILPQAVILLIYLAATILVARYASALRLVDDSGAARDVELALSRQRTFWKALGVAVAILLALFAVSIVVGIGAAVMQQL